METLSPQEPQAPERPENREHSGIGPFAAIVIVIILLVLGGIYFLLERAAKLHSQQLPGQEQVNS